MPFRIPKLRRVPAYLRGHAQQMNAVADIINRGLVINAERLQDGRCIVAGGSATQATRTTVIQPITPGPGSGGTFTEFYCGSGGSPYNAGDTAGAPIYTSTNGNWNSGTFVFTPTDGSNPASSGVVVGSFANVHLDGPTGGVTVARITTVINAANGAITLSTTAAMGNGVATGATGRTIIVGGVWGGPGGLTSSDGNPFNQPNLGRLRNASGDMLRINVKSDHTYTVTAALTLASSPVNPYIVQGYTTALGDGGKATISSNVSGSAALTLSSAIATLWADIIFVSTASSGSQPLVTSSTKDAFYRCVFHGARDRGLAVSAGGTVIECEAYDCCKSNTANSGAFYSNDAGAGFIRCYSHDNAGSNADGFYFNVSGILDNCISESNGGAGVRIVTSASSIKNCDFYNNTGAAIHIAATSGGMQIESCNFLKNNRGINNAGGSLLGGFTVNCGYGSGTMANSNADVLGPLQNIDPFTYDSGVSPWAAVSTGNFTILSDSPAYQIGRGAFTQTGSSKTGTVGVPNIGAA